MHKFHLKDKALVFCLALILPASLVFAAAQGIKTTEVKPKTVSKQDLKKNIKNKTSKKQAKQVKQTEQTKSVEVKTPTVAKSAAPVTPDKKKYASPNGYQVMTDGSVVDFRSMGVINMHGYRYSYYSSKVLYHYKTSEWYACDDHLYRTADGYIIVASKDHPFDTIVPTPFGKGKVLDRCYQSGVIDIYVNF